MFLVNKHWISKDTLKIITEKFKNLPKMSVFRHWGAERARRRGMASMGSRWMGLLPFLL